MVSSMKVEVEEVSAVSRKLLVAVPSQEVDQKVDHAYRVWGKKARIKGFRPGKAPRSVLERYFKKQIEEEVSQELLRDSIDEALKEVNLQPVTIRFPEKVPLLIPGDDYKYSVEMEISPEFTPDNYFGLSLSAEKIEVSEEMVDKRLAEIQESNATLEPIADHRPIQSGDFVLLDHQAFWEDQPVEGGSRENYHLEVGVGRFDPGFEQRLVGMAPGQEEEFQVELASDFYNPLMAGKTIDFKVKIHAIKEKQVRPLDDAFAQALDGKFQTLDDLRQAVQSDLILQAERQHKGKLREQLFDQIIEASPFEVPPSLVLREQERLLREQMNIFQQRGLNMVGMDEEKLLAALKGPGERRARLHLILEKIAAQEKITVNPAEVEMAYHQMAAQMQEDVARLKKFYQDNDLEDDLKRQLREDKTMELLLEKSIISTPATATEVVETAGEGN